jgi:hypothetical protein
MSSSEPVEVVTLNGGRTVTVAALQLLLELERRGHELAALEDGRLRIRPRVSPEERDAVVRHRDELLRLIQYCDGMVQ